MDHELLMQLVYYYLSELIIRTYYQNISELLPDIKEAHRLIPTCLFERNDKLNEARIDSVGFCLWY